MRARIQKLIKPADHSFVCFRRIDPFFSFYWHYHPELELTWIESSSGKRVVGDNVSDYGPGDLVLLGSNLPHTWASSDSGTSRDLNAARAVVVQFDAQFAGAALCDAPEMRPVRRMFEASSRGMSFDARASRDAVRHLSILPDLEGPRRLIGLLEALATLAANAGRARTLASPAFNPVWNGDAQRRIERVCRHIQEHLAEPLRQGSLAKLAGMNASAFGRFFRQATGATVVDYINDIRIGHACRLLIDTEESILGISSKSGFNNLSHFNRQFRRLRGSTPSVFRERFSAAEAT
jgi:AraC-like DNA-binding protein